MNSITFEVEISPNEKLPISKPIDFLSDLIEEILIETISENGIDAEVTVRCITSEDY